MKIGTATQFAQSFGALPSLLKNRANFRAQMDTVSAVVLSAIFKDVMRDLEWVGMGVKITARNCNICLLFVDDFMVMSISQAQQGRQGTPYPPKLQRHPRKRHA
ncbi:unnamed protein product [Heligmosomoides polygyrus]|uniref:Reverse transcriptase domain-containing protein n=1 Tax=Heligmosomoides polygyrus TaxID=6339 RepID=A0A183F7A6_HELPZ|nr:unnamed protein product [Heligmosomoides polygyrus]